jgi:hypothetical protein
MRRPIFSLAIAFLFAACGGGESDPGNIYKLSRDPVSVRGWILDVKGARTAESAEMEIARRQQLFAATSVWVENSQYASGGVAENGAFIVLDVPPQKATLGFNAPGAESAQLVLENVPGNADVVLPDVILSNGGTTFLDPSKLVVRMAASVDKPTPTGQFATVNGVRVPIVNTPIRDMVDRRDYPNPGGIRPVATVK